MWQVEITTRFSKSFGIIIYNWLQCWRRGIRVIHRWRSTSLPFFPKYRSLSKHHASWPLTKLPIPWIYFASWGSTSLPNDGRCSTVCTNLLMRLAWYSSTQLIAPTRSTSISFMTIVMMLCPSSPSACSLGYEYRSCSNNQWVEGVRFGGCSLHYWELVDRWPTFPVCRWWDYRVYGKECRNRRLGRQKLASLP